MDKPNKTKPNQAQGATPRHEIKCCLCGRTITRPAWDKTDSPYYMGTNNPWPFSTDDAGARCCDDRNALQVTPCPPPAPFRPACLHEDSARWSR